MEKQYVALYASYIEDNDPLFCDVIGNGTLEECKRYVTNAIKSDIEDDALSGYEGESAKQTSDTEWRWENNAGTEYRKYRIVELR